MSTSTTKKILLGLMTVLLPWSLAWAQISSESKQSSTPVEQTPISTKESFNRAIKQKNDWYFSWGFSRQQYAPSDSHIAQPDLGNDFTIYQAKASDFPSSFEDTITSTLKLKLTDPQQNIRIGKFLNPEKTFAVEFSYDHSKYNTDFYQTAQITGTKNNVPQNGPIVLTPQDFSYALHNGLNHLMINAVWLHRLDGQADQPGDLQLISRLGAGILLPHADNIIFGNENQVGPKGQNVCCTNKSDWWQINGWTAGVEVGLRYTFYKSVYLELTQKVAYGALKGVPVYRGSADQTIWMSEQVLSTGFLF
jgi:hypothetical protein